MIRHYNVIIQIALPPGCKMKDKDGISHPVIGYVQNIGASANHATYLKSLITHFIDHGEICWNESSIVETNGDDLGEEMSKAFGEKSSPIWFKGPMFLF